MGKFCQISTELWPLIDVKKIHSISLYINYHAKFEENWLKINQVSSSLVSMVVDIKLSRDKFECQ